MTLAIDFGTCNTILAHWHPVLRQVETVRLGTSTRLYDYSIPEISINRVSAVIPSLIHYKADGSISIGSQVEDAGRAVHANTFRWLKLDILKGNNRTRRINGMLITPRQAASDLLRHILQLAVDHQHEDLVATLPVEAYDLYADWIQSAVAPVWQGRVQMLDEATACILGYGDQVREGRIYAIFDFGGGTLDISIVRVLDLATGQAPSCVVLGRAGEEIGGILVDQWLVHELQQVQGISNQVMADIGGNLLHAVEQAKIRLSGGAECVEVAYPNYRDGRPLRYTFTAADLRRILTVSRETLGKHSLYRLVTLTMERALAIAYERCGVRKSEIRAVFMVGGSSLLMGIGEIVRLMLPHCPIRREDPFEAIAKGACRYAGGNLNLALVHDYCLRVWNPECNDYILVPIVPMGTYYPTDNPVAVKYLKAACEGATQLGLVVIERSNMIRPVSIWDMPGRQLQPQVGQWNENSVLRELNPTDREFIHVNPPCTVGDRRFVISFGVDASKRITISLKDLDPANSSYIQLSTGEQIRLPVRNLPLVKL